jgi:cytochrome c
LGRSGPGCGQDSRHGPRGYDEFNQAKKAGNFGWPYFVGNTIAYNDSDFATKAVGALFNPAAPVNESPNNTGMKNLPPAQNPLVWYPYSRSEEFPDLGEGGRCAMGGPVYHLTQRCLCHQAAGILRQSLVCIRLDAQLGVCPAL